MKFLGASLGVLVAVSAFGHARPAVAAGCGGYVNVWVSGCAPWDNNPRRMPGAPGYVAPRVTAPAVPTQPTTRFVQPPAGNSLFSNSRGGLISDNGHIMRNNNQFISDQGGGLRR